MRSIKIKNYFIITLYHIIIHWKQRWNICFIIITSICPKTNCLETVNSGHRHFELCPSPKEFSREFQAYRVFSSFLSNNLQLPESCRRTSQILFDDGPCSLLKRRDQNWTVRGFWDLHCSCIPSFRGTSTKRPELSNFSPIWFASLSIEACCRTIRTRCLGRLPAVRAKRCIGDVRDSVFP